MFDTLKGHSKDVVTLRWLPDLFVDVLYEHTQDLLESAGVPRQKVMKVTRSQGSGEQMIMEGDEEPSTDEHSQDSDVSKDTRLCA